MRNEFKKSANECAHLLIAVLNPFAERHNGKAAEVVNEYTDLISQAAHMENNDFPVVPKRLIDELRDLILEHFGTDKPSVQTLAACINISFALMAQTHEPFARALERLHGALRGFHGEDYALQFFETMGA